MEFRIPNSADEATSSRTTIFPDSELLRSNWEPHLSTFSSPKPKLKSASSKVEHQSKAQLSTVRESKPEQLKVIYESPWRSYQELLHRTIGEEVVVAFQKKNPSLLVAIRRIPVRECVSRSLIIGQIKHTGFVKTLGIFNDDIDGYLITEYLEIAISQLCSSPIRPSENQIQSMLYQVIVSPGALFSATNRY